MTTLMGLASVARWGWWLSAAHSTMNAVVPEAICFPIVLVGLALFLLTVSCNCDDQPPVDRWHLPSECWMRAVFEYALDAYHLHATDGTILGGNQAARQLTGYERGELIGRSLLELGLLSDEQAPRVKAMLAKSAEGRIAGPEEFTIVSRDGTERIVETSAYPACVGSDKMVLSISRDITARKQAEEEVHRHRDFVDSIIQHSPAFFVTVDRDGRVMAMNDTMLKALGYTLDEVVGKDVVKTFVVAEEQPRSDQISDMLLEGHQPAFHDVRMLTRDGRELLANWNATPMLDDNGQVAYYHSVGIDVTFTRKLERQMHEVQKMQAVGVLAAGIAHDFNNLLGNMMGRASLMLSVGEANPAIRKHLQQIVESCERGASLVQRLLTFSHRAEPRAEATDIGHVVAETGTLLADTLPSRVEVRVAVDDELWPVHADPYQIEQALLNLGINAAEAMSGEGTVTIRAENYTPSDARADRVSRLRADEPYVLLTVSDTGPGVASETRSQIFDPFFTSKSRAGHSGLGLAVVHGIVHSHGGAIEVPELATGAAFRLYFPAIASDVSSDEADTADIRGSFSRRSALVLVVDDEPGLVHLVSDMLEHQGHRALTAHSGAEGLAHLEARCAEIDLVILDMVMPVMDGEEFLEHMERMCPDVPVLLVTGQVPYSPPCKSRASNIRGFLPKPFSAAQVWDMVAAILESRRALKSRS